MAKRKYNTAIELQVSTAIDAITAGYLGLGAKSDGLYIKNSAGLEGKIWHSANDGAGSGLDADLLDGQHWAYVHSRAQNLVSNGSALLANNTNFSSFIFDGSQAYYSNGSFKYTRGVESVFVDEYIPVNPVNRYRLEMHAKTLNGTGRYYAMVACYDVDGNPVNASNHMFRAGSLTTLAQPLNNGDTVVYLTSAENWYNDGTAGVNTHLRTITLWNWTNSYGYLYPPETYSRRVYHNSWDPGAIDYINNTITLRVPWANGLVPAGTPLSNGSSGGTYKYIALSNTLIPTSWTYYSGVMDGIDLSGTNVSGKFPPGTAKVRVGWLMDYQYTVIDTAWFTNIAFLLDDSSSAILAKLLTVDGANSGLDADTLDGNHASAFSLTSHTHNQLVGNNYGGYGTELPNNAIFGSGKLRYQMLASNIGTGTWYDTLWISSYTGADVKGSNQLLFSKEANRVFFRRQNYDATAWGTAYEFWHTGNFNPSNYSGTGHLHDDRYYTETESDARFSPIVHNHDDRYYTEAEADNRYPILSGGLIPNAYLPSYVDDVIEVANNPSLPAQGESGKIYVTIDDNKTYRWSGSYYVEISASLALGETSSTAYRGDRGKIAYDHSQILGGTGVHISDTERTNWNLAYSWGNHSGLYVPIAHLGSGGANHAAATTEAAGFMSASDKSALNALIIHSHALDNLSDVSISGIQDFDLICFDGAEWVNDPVFGIAALANPGRDQLLMFDNTTGKFAWSEVVAGVTINNQLPNRVITCGASNNILEAQSDFVYQKYSGKSELLIQGDNSSTRAVYRLDTFATVPNGNLFLAYNPRGFTAGNYVYVGQGKELLSIVTQADVLVGGVAQTVDTAKISMYAAEGFDRDFYGTSIDFMNVATGDNHLITRLSILNTTVNASCLYVGNNFVGSLADKLKIDGTSLFTGKAVFTNGIEVSGLTAQLGNTRLEGAQYWKVQTIVSNTTLGNYPAVFIGGAARTTTIPAAGNPPSEQAYWLVTGPTYSQNFNRSGTDSIYLNGVLQSSFPFSIGANQLVFLIAAAANTWHILTLR